MRNLELTHLLRQAYGETVEKFNLETLPRGNSGLFKTRISGSVNRRRFSAVVKGRQDFRDACSVLFEGRERWKGESRVLVYNDFHPSYVALPMLGLEFAILFDWELAGIGFPHFDLQNFWTDRDVDRERILSVYLDYAREVDVDRFVSVMPYAEFCRQFYTLWLPYLKLEADPGGKLPTWLRLGSERLFSGELARLAEGVLL